MSGGLANCVLTEVPALPPAKRQVVLWLDGDTQRHTAHEWVRDRQLGCQGKSNMPPHRADQCIRERPPEQQPTAEKGSAKVEAKTG